MNKHIDKEGVCPNNYEHFFKIMRTTIFLLFFSVLITQASNSYSQETKLSLRLKSASIKDICKEIEAKSDYIFVFSDNTKKIIEKKVNIEANSKNIMDVLDDVLSESGLSYRIIDKQIVVYREKDAPNTEELHKIQSETVQQQQKRITGRITDQNGQAVIGANVVVKGTTNGTTTDLDGNFSMQVPPKATLQITYIGYLSQEVEVSNNDKLDIVLKEDTQSLEEVVVVGFGTQKKASVVGAIQNINPSELQISSQKNISNTLAGKLAGVIAITRSGEPGYDQSSFWIRGISSFSGATSPLVLVDGVQRTLDDLDISEIESFSILKDAAASAMYGVRGANGVILVNTKRGKVQKPEVSVRLEHALTTPTKLPDYINAADHMQLLNDLATEEGKVLYYSQEAIDKTRSGYDRELYSDINWLNAISKDYAYNTRASLNVNGGSDIIRYNLTGAVYNEKGIMEVDETLPYDTGTNLSRYNLRANVDIDITKTTSLRFSVGGYLQKLRKQSNSTETTWNYAFDTPPMVHPAIYADGKIPVRSQRVNPWAYLTQYGYSINTSSKIESLFAIDQKLDMVTKGLSSKLTFSFDNYSTSSLSRSKSPSYYQPATSRDDEGNLILTLSSSGSEFLSYSNGSGYGNNQTYLEWTLNYDRTFNKDHNVSALLLYNQRSYDDGGLQPYRNQGIAGRASYSYQSKYVGEFNFGYNGSENFAKGKRYGFFPSVALGWIVSEENFWEPVKDKITFLKTRLSWGQAGNDQIGSSRRFAYLTTMNASNTGYYWGNTGDYYRAGVTEGEIGVNNLTWETVTKKNAGIEIGLWNKINIQADVFRENRKNIFMQRRTIPTQAGFLSTPYANFGKVENQGGELAITFNHKIDEVRFNIYTNITYAKNKILEYDVPIGQKGTHQDITGHSVNELYGYKAVRLYTDADFNADGTLLESLPQNELTDVRPGDIMLLDWNDDGVINSKDKGYVGGTTDPRLVYGLGGGAQAYGFDFSIFFQGVGDTYRFIGNESNYFIPGSGQGIQGNIFSNYTDRWTVENPSQDVFWPRLSYATNYNNNANSTWWKKDMSFIRLKQIEVGYTFPKTFIPQLKNKRVYINGNNLLTFSKFKLWDPELNTSSGSRYPSLKSVMFGLEFTF